MPADKYIALDTTTGRLRQVSATDQSTGAAQAGDVVALDATGKLDPSLLPSGVGGGGQVVAINTTEALTAGDWVNIFNSSGQKACRKALAQDATKPAHGYVLESYGSGVLANVYIGGVNSKIALTGFAVADIGARAFLSPTTSGGTTKTMPQTAGQLVQAVGSVIDVDANNVSVEMEFGEQIIF